MLNAPFKYVYLNVIVSASGQWLKYQEFYTKHCFFPLSLSFMQIYTDLKNTKLLCNTLTTSPLTYPFFELGNHNQTRRHVGYFHIVSTRSNYIRLPPPCDRHWGSLLSLSQSKMAVLACLMHASCYKSTRAAFTFLQYFIQANICRGSLRRDGKILIWQDRGK